MDVRARQQPLKERYRAEPGSSRITLVAHGGSGDTPITCSVEVGRAIHEAQAHAGVGGDGTAACSGDMLLGALAACAQITLQMVAAALGIELARAEVTVEGDLDLAGTLGLSRETRVGFEAIRLRFDVEAPGADAAQLAALREKTERYCVVAQTLHDPPPLQVEFT